jgi:hypothetical protein
MQLTVYRPQCRQRGSTRTSYVTSNLAEFMKLTEFAATRAWSLPDHRQGQDPA